MATWASLTLCNFADVQLRIKGLPYASKNGTFLSASVDEKQGVVKDLMGDMILSWLKKSYPNQVQDWITMLVDIYSNARKRISSEYEATGINSIVQFPGSELQPFDLENYLQLGQGVKPKTFFKQAAPVSGSNGDFKGIADNGAFYVDTLNEELYINLATSDTTVTWTLFETDNLIDFILNPEKLNRPAVTGIIWQLLEEGTLKLKGEGNFAGPSELMDKSIPRYQKMFQDHMDLALSLIKIDSSGDGLISNFEKRIGQSSNFIF